MKNWSVTDLLTGNTSDTSKNTGPNATPSYHGLLTQNWYERTASQYNTNPVFSPMERAALKILLIAGIAAYAIYYLFSRGYLYL